MATQNVSTRLRLNGYTMFVEWDPMGSTDTSEVVEYSDWPDKTIHATGTWGGATLTVEGSNDNSDWATLTSIHNTSLSVTDDCIHAIAENTRYLRVATTGGDTTTAVTVSFTAL